MKSTNHPNTQTFSPSRATRGNRAECDESGFNTVIELDEYELAQVAGGVSHADFTTTKSTDKASAKKALQACLACGGQSPAAGYARYHSFDAAACLPYLDST